MKIAGFLTIFAITPLAGHEPDPVMLDNGHLRLGIDRSSGGSIFFLGESRTGRNVLNHADRGRFIQQSYYGRRDGSDWAGKPWRWNPVQGGNWKGKPAKLVKLDYDPGIHRLYAKTVPHHWAGGRLLPETVMEQWISLEGEVAKVRFRFRYRGETSHPPSDQELPAVFADYALPNLVLYDGERPWTGGPLTRVVPGWPNEPRKSTEQWAAYLDDMDWGLGVCFPGSTRLTTYRHPGPAGPRGMGCSYFAPLRTMPIAPGCDFEYTVYLTIGSLSAIRERFAALPRMAGRAPDPAR